MCLFQSETGRPSSGCRLHSTARPDGVICGEGYQSLCLPRYVCGGLVGSCLHMRAPELVLA